METSGERGKPLERVEHGRRNDDRAALTGEGRDGGACDGVAAAVAVAVAVIRGWQWPFGMSLSRSQQLQIKRPGFQGMETVPVVVCGGEWLDGSFISGSRAVHHSMLLETFTAD